MKNKVLVCAALAAFVLLVGCSKSPDTEQIKTDLIGQTMGSMFGGWKFESLSEFQELKINNKKQQGELIEYDISMRLKDTNSGKEYRAEALRVYKKVDGAWKIASISRKSFEPIR